MYAGSFVLHTLFLMLILDNPWTYGTESDNCTIAVIRGTEYTKKPGDLATIKCPVTHCQEKPVLFWYKDGKLIVQDGQRHNSSWMNDKLFVLTISSVDKNDSGQYHCAGKVGTGHSTKVIILDENEQQNESNRTTNPTEDDEKNKQWIIYCLPVLGALCLLTLSCFGLLYFARKHSAKNKKTDDVLQSEMKVFTVYAGAQHCTDGTIHDSDEGPVCHQDAKSCLLPFQDGTADYDNDIPCWKASGTSTGKIPHPACDYSVLMIHPPLPATTQETLLYATLNHDQPFQRSEPSVETECIEYAVIGMKNKFRQRLSSP
ncbi:hypothetical protein lerEdw1_011368 [Lerista edwardsae]|nr:hypothetical protein lerEdw1_011368 [Lerista edwardsae]